MSMEPLSNETLASAPRPKICRNWAQSPNLLDFDLSSVVLKSYLSERCTLVSMDMASFSMNDR